MESTIKKIEKISASIFRAYDIRGIVGETLTPETIFLLGRALGSEARARHETKVIIGRDGRLSGPELSASLAQGLLASGCDVIDIGAIPTPLLYFATHILDTKSGVMLTGSHNPSNYNGLKMVLAGKTLADAEIQTLYQRIVADKFTTGQGKLNTTDIVQQYIDTVCADIQLSKPLKIVIDGGNGIAGKIAPLLFKKLGCEIISLFCEVDGNFPNHHPDPSQPENLQDLIQVVLQHKADVGLAFDGDGDRLGIITNRGEIIWPDRQLMLFATDILSRHPKANIIYDVKCTGNLGHIIQSHSGNPIMWKTGHSLIKAKMREVDALLAGEMSGHIFFKERWLGFDDGLYAGARLLEILAKDHRDVNTIFQSFPDGVNTPELRLAIAEEQKFIFVERFIAEAKFEGAKISTIDGIRVDFPHGWGLLRASNTSPYLILRFEADAQQGLKQIQEIFRQQLLKLNPHLTLPF